MTELTAKGGFASAASEAKLSRRRSAGVELATSLGLVVSLIIAVTAVSIGVARARPHGAGFGTSLAPPAIAVPTVPSQPARSHETLRALPSSRV